MAKIEGKKGSRVSGAAREKAAADAAKAYDAGASVRDIADDLGRSFGFVHRLLDEAGVEMRPRGGATRKG